MLPFELLNQHRIERASKQKRQPRVAFFIMWNAVINVRRIHSRHDHDRGHVRVCERHHNNRHVHVRAHVREHGDGDGDGDGDGRAHHNRNRGHLHRHDDGDRARRARGRERFLPKSLRG